MNDEVEHGTIRIGITTQGSPVESRYLTSAILSARLSGLSSRGPALVFDRVLSLRSAVKLDHLENDTLMYTHTHTMHFALLALSSLHDANL
jgi:hypothetical protein